MSTNEVFRVEQAQNPWRLHPDETAAAANQRETVVEGHHTWKLPSIECPACNRVWGTGGLSYPWLDGSSLKPKHLFKGNVVSVLSPTELEPILVQVRQMLPQGSLLLPGTSLGPFKGSIYGPLLDFWFLRGKKLIRESAYARLRTDGVLRVDATRAEMKDRTRKSVDYLELHLTPRARLGAPMEERPGAIFCGTCGFDSRNLPNPLVIKRQSIPEQAEVFQLFEAPAVKLAKAVFVEAVTALGLSGLEFTPVEVVG